MAEYEAPQAEPGADASDTRRPCRAPWQVLSVDASLAVCIGTAPAILPQRYIKSIGVLPCIVVGSCGEPAGDLTRWSPDVCVIASSSGIALVAARAPRREESIDRQASRSSAGQGVQLLGPAVHQPCLQRVQPCPSRAYRPQSPLAVPGRSGCSSAATPRQQLLASW
jgi:hypothetical protein